MGAEIVWLRVVSPCRSWEIGDEPLYFIKVGRRWGGGFFTSLATVRFVRWAVLHGVCVQDRALWQDVANTVKTRRDCVWNFLTR